MMKRLLFYSKFEAIIIASTIYLQPTSKDTTAETKKRN